MSVFAEKNLDTLMSLPRAERRKIVEQMDPVEVMELSLALPWNERLRLLEESPHFPDIVNSYPIQELYWTIKATGPRDSLSVLRSLGPEGLQFIFDLEWWERDTFIPQKALAWMILLFEASEEKVVQWVLHITQKDEALIPLLLRSFLKVVKRPDDMDIQEARDVLPPFTLDDVYYVKFLNMELQPLWGRFLALLFSQYQGLYRDLMEAILWETATEEMEMAYKWRHSRLSDQGIPDYFDAIDIFAFAPGLKVREIGREEVEVLGHDQDLPMTFVPTLYVEGADTLLKALQELRGTRFMDRVVQEWIGVANKIVVAERIDLDEPDALLGALIEASSLINLGLECYIAQRNVEPHVALKYAVLEDLVRLGITRVKLASRPIRDLLRREGVSEELFILPDGLRERALSMVKEPPKVWDEGEYKERPVVNLKDLERMEADALAVQDLVRAGEMIEPAWPKWPDEIGLEGTNINDIRELDLLKGLVTALGNYLLRGRAVVEPIDEGELGTLFEAFKNVDDLEDLIKGALNWQGTTPSTPFLTLVSNAISSIVEEWVSTGSPDRVDGLFVTGLLVRLGSYRA